jgi:seryl-tRNA synthetase
MNFGKKHTIQFKDGKLITQDSKITNLLLKKEALVKDGRELSKQIESMEQERNKLALQIQKIKDKLTPFTKSIKKEHLGKYEDIESIDIDGDNIVIKPFDYIEEYKKVLDEKFKKE